MDTLPQDALQYMPTKLMVQQMSSSTLFFSPTHAQTVLGCHSNFLAKKQVKDPASSGSYRPVMRATVLSKILETVELCIQEQ